MARSTRSSIAATGSTTMSWRTSAASARRASSVEAGVGDEHVRLVEPGDRADADDAPLRMVGDDDQPAAGLDERPVRVGLEEVRAGEPGMRVHAVDADEHEVHVDGAQGRDRERAHERLRRRPHAAGQDDRLVRAADLVEHVRDADRVGDHGQPRHVGEALRQRVGRGARRHADRHARLDEGGRRVGDRVLLGLLERGLGREPGLEEGVRRDATSPRRGPSRAARDRRGSRGRVARSCRRRRARGPGPRRGPPRPRGRVRG